MKNKYRNIFLAFGIVAVLIMIFTFDMDYQELWANLKRATPRLMITMPTSIPATRRKVTCCSITILQLCCPAGQKLSS